MKRYLRILIAVALLLTVSIPSNFIPVQRASASSKDNLSLPSAPEGEIDESSVNLISASHEKVALQVGESCKIHIYMDLGGNKDDITHDVSWAIQDSGIVSIDNGTFNATAVGSTYVTVTYGEQKLTISVRVSPNLSRSEIDTNVEDNISDSKVLPNENSEELQDVEPKLVASQQAVKLKVGSGKQLKVEYQHPDGTKTDVTDQAEWKAIDESIVSVSNGAISAHAAGETLITIQYEGLTIGIEITVEDPQEKIRLNVTQKMDSNVLNWNEEENFIRYSVKKRGSLIEDYEEVVSNLTESSYIDHALNQFTDGSTYYVVTGMTEAGEMITSNEVEIASDANKLNSVLSGEIVPFETPGPFEDTIGAAGYNWYSITVQANHTIRVFTPDLSGTGTSKNIYSDPNQARLAYTTKDTLTYTPKDSGTHYIKIVGNSGQKFTMSVGDGADFDQAYVVTLEKVKGNLGSFASSSGDGIFFLADLKAGYHYHVWADTAAKGWVLYDYEQREILSGSTSRTDIWVETDGTYYIKILTGEDIGEHQYNFLKTIPLSDSDSQTYTMGPEKEIWYLIKGNANHTLKVYTPGLSGYGTGKYLYDDPNQPALEMVSGDTLTFTPTNTGLYFINVSGSSGKTFSITASDGSNFDQAHIVSMDGLKGNTDTLSTPSNDEIFFKTELKAGFNYYLWGEGTCPIVGWILYDSAQKELLTGTTSRADIKVETSGTYYIKMLTGENAGENKYYWLKSIALSTSDPQTNTMGPEKEIWYQVKVKANHTLKVSTPGLSGYGTGKYLYENPNQPALKMVSGETLTYTPTNTGTYFINVSGNSGKTFSITASDGSDIHQAYIVSLDDIKGTIDTFFTPSDDCIYFRADLKAGFNYHLWGEGSSPLDGWVLYDSAKREVLSGSNARMDIRIETSGTYYVKMLTGGSSGENKYDWLRSTTITFPSPQTDTFGPGDDIWYVVKGQANQTMKVVQEGLSWSGSIAIFEEPNSSDLASSSGNTLTFTPSTSGIYFIRLSDLFADAGDKVTINIEGVELWQPPSPTSGPGEEDFQFDTLDVNSFSDVLKSDTKPAYFKMTSKSTGVHRIFTSPYQGNGPEIDTKLSIYTDPNLQNEIAMNDNHSGPYGSQFSKIEWAATANTTYYIQLESPETLQTRLTLEEDLDSSRGTALSAEWDEIYTDRLSSPYDVDYYKLVITEPSQIHLFVTSNVVSLEDNEGNLIQTFYPNEPDTLFYAGQNGTYYAKVGYNAPMSLNKSGISTMAIPDIGEYKTTGKEMKLSPTYAVIDATPGFKKSATFKWTFKSPHAITNIQVFKVTSQNQIGEKVYEQSRTNLNAGEQHTFTWDGTVFANHGSFAPSGRYRVKIVTADFPQWPISADVVVRNTVDLEQFELTQLLNQLKATIPSEKISRMQEYLQVIGFYDGDITGEYDSELLMSVIAYQVTLNKWSTHVAKDVYERKMEYLQEDGIITDRLLGYAYADASLGHNIDGETIEIFLLGDSIIVAEATGIVAGAVVSGTVVYFRGSEFVKRAFTYLKNERGSIKIGNVAKLGTGRVGDFTGIRGSSVDDILSRIPSNATRRELIPIKGKVEQGFEYKWVDPQSGQTWRVRVHGPDPSAPAGSNAINGWIVRVQKGKQYMDHNGTFHPPGISKPDSPFYNETLINDTHIPIQWP